MPPSTLADHLQSTTNTLSHHDHTYSNHNPSSTSPKLFTQQPSLPATHPNPATIEPPSSNHKLHCYLHHLQHPAPPRQQLIHCHCHHPSFNPTALHFLLLHLLIATTAIANTALAAIFSSSHCPHAQLSHVFFKPLPIIFLPFPATKPNQSHHPVPCLCPSRISVFNSFLHQLTHVSSSRQATQQQPLLHQQHFLTTITTPPPSSSSSLLHVQPSFLQPHGFFPLHAQRLCFSPSQASATACHTSKPCSPSVTTHHRQPLLHHLLLPQPSPFSFPLHVPSLPLLFFSATTFSQHSSDTSPSFSTRPTPTSQAINSASKLD